MTLLTISLLISTCYLLGIPSNQNQLAHSYSTSSSSSILQFKTTTKSLIPSIFFFPPENDSTQPQHDPSLDPIPDNEPVEPQGQPNPSPESSAPTWVKMIGAVVNIFLSLYQYV